MRIHDHLEKAARIERTRNETLRSDSDYILYVDSFMISMTHQLNVVLHALNLTPESFDLVHTYLPKLDRPLPTEVVMLMDLVRDVERMRPGYLRGDIPWSPIDGQRCLSNAEKLRRALEGILSK
jgi:hypothetical protein